MNASEIKARKQKLNEKLAKAKAKVRSVQAQMEGLREMCPHTNSYRTSHMGENCRDCPDCGMCVW